MDLRALFKSIELLSRRVSDIEKLASNLHVRLLPPTAWCIVIVQIKDIFAGGGFYTVQKMVGTPNTAGKHATSKTDLHMPEGLTVATGERIDILINLAEDQDTAAHHLHNTDYHLAVRVGQFVKNGNNGSVGMQDVLVTDWMPPTRTLKITDIYGMDSIGGSTGGGRYKAQLVLGTATQVAPDNTTLHLPDHGETLQGTNTYVFENLAENGIGGHALKTDGTCFVTGIFVGLTSDKPPNFIYRGYAAGPSDGGLVAITGSATGGGKYEGVILGPPGADVAATGDLARSDLGVSGEACLVLNTREEGKSTHDLAASGYLPLVFVYAFRRRNSDGKLVVAINGTQWLDCVPASS